MTNDGVGLPVRLHDLLLALAGRVDDDALTQARELLAVAELDRAVELVVGCLLAGRIPVSPEERHEIGWLLGEVRSDRSLADRLFAVERVPVVKHRFSVESDPAEGLGDVLGKTVSVLPDVRGVRATWRSSPAGATPGPLPQRVVLVDIGPAGFAPATAYRVDTVLRKAGIRAAVEVLTAGTQLGEYHAAAVTTAREVFFPSGSTSPQPPPDPTTWFDGEPRDQAPVIEPEPVPAEPQNGSKSRRARVESYEGVQPFPPKPVKRLPVREPVEDVHVEQERVEDVHVEDMRVEDARVEDIRAEDIRVDGVRVDGVHVEEVRVEEVRPDQARVEEAPVVREAVPEPPPVIEQPRPAPMFAFPDDHPLSRAEVTTELGPDDLAALQAALAEGQPPAAVQLPPTVDAKLSDRERALLQQLHEELAQREQQSWPGGPEYVNGAPKPTNGKYPG
ncbi:hypothetical protein IOD16_38050 [Saccharothrix sp. 6-C]|uniref:hypothetical protein n=1 Tax=Saccharothrix sp. 6-C TaxID=2781735 RepID=UPI0019174DD1|nr:hypothetical protein [Saccharothrix sp. 6-C]QQQ76712.1 hypothetical protein IOD16_38050 [Saccharothrix sp. 6-C]